MSEGRKPFAAPTTPHRAEPAWWLCGLPYACFMAGGTAFAMQSLWSRVNQGTLVESVARSLMNTSKRLADGAGVNDDISEAVLNVARDTVRTTHIILVVAPPMCMGFWSWVGKQVAQWVRSKLEFTKGKIVTLFLFPLHVGALFMGSLTAVTTTTSALTSVAGSIAFKLVWAAVFGERSKLNVLFGLQSPMLSPSSD